MKAVVLASGSEGNSTFFSTGSCKLLLDIGKNAKYIKEKILEIGEDPTQIEAVLISHTHDDHVSALKVFLKKYQPYVYVTEKMFYDLDFLKDYPKVVIYDEDFYIQGLSVKTFRTSHDATDSRNFVLYDGKESLVYLTDTGYLNRKYFPMLKNQTYYLMESNHDIAMLMEGPYPKWLKQRVLGTLGHLSNKDSSFYLTKLVGEDTKKIVLMHLSKTNNTEEKALQTFFDTFKEYDMTFQNVVCARQNEVTRVCDDQDLVCR